jgi:phage terminase small subunit
MGLDMSAYDQLQKRQQRFVDEYLIDLNGTQAAIRTGYAERSAFVQASRLLSDAKIQAAVAEKKEIRAQRMGLDQDFVLSGIQKLITRCEQAEPVLDREGNPKGEYRFDASSALKGYELLGKHLGIWRDKVELSGKDGGPIQTAVRLEFVEAPVRSEDGEENG